MNISGYFERPGRRFTCRDCGWNGLGVELDQGELFREVVEYDCPRCHERVASVAFPTADEVRDAAKAGVQEAVAMLDDVERAESRWRRVETTRVTPIAEPAGLALGGVRCALHLEDDDESETWLVLTANAVELHRELAVWESIEPARRLLSVMRERYGNRLVQFDYGAAFLFLAGDRLGALAELNALVQDLPEPSS